MNLSIKESIQMPSLMISPFQNVTHDTYEGEMRENFGDQIQGFGGQITLTDEEESKKMKLTEVYEEQTQIPSAKTRSQLKTKRESNIDLKNELGNENVGKDLQRWQNNQRDSTPLNLNSNQKDSEQHPDTIIKHYMKQLMTSGRTDNEIVSDIEKYYNQLCNNCDQEILRLREDLIIAQAEERTKMAEDLVIPRNELDDLSNFFLECIYAHQKKMRQNLIRMNFKND